MRIIAGKFRGRKLKSPPSLETRPTSDRLRETLFNVIAPRLEGAWFLDLCAGSGAVGIEAISRGAAHVDFVDKSREMGYLIRENLDLCRVGAEEFELLVMEAGDFLRRHLRRMGQPWTVVFFDPPYAEDYERILQLVGTEASVLLDKEGLLIVEHHHKNKLPEVCGRLRRLRVLKQGDSALTFYERAIGADSVPVPPDIDL